MQPPLPPLVKLQALVKQPQLELQLMELHPPVRQGPLLPPRTLLWRSSPRMLPIRVPPIRV
jgi:hypothetical protein